MNFLTWLRPSRTVPITRWRAAQPWRPRPSTVVVLVTGLAIFGLGDAFIVQGSLGVSPWTVLAQGLTDRTGLSLGLTTFIVSCTVLLLWIPLRERPGLGTVMNIVVIATMIQVGVQTLPVASGWLLQLAFVLIGIGLIGLGSGLYLTCHLGPGPRDGWMTGIHRRTGWPVVRVRFGIEAFVLAAGWLLGGTIGLGTVLFAVLIGPAVGFGLRFAGRLGATPGPAMVESDEEFPELDA